MGTWFPTFSSHPPKLSLPSSQEENCWTKWATTLLRSLMELRSQGEPLLWELERGVNTEENSLWGTAAPGEFKLLRAQFWGSPTTQVLSFIYTQSIHFSATQAYSQRKLPDRVWSRVRSVRRLKPTLASLSHGSWGENSWQTLLKAAAHGLRSPGKQKTTKTQTEKGLRFNHKMIECLRSPAPHHHISRAPA